MVTNQYYTCPDQQEKNTLEVCVRNALTFCNFENLPKEEIYLRIIYKDRFNYRHEGSYPIDQMMQRDRTIPYGYYRQENSLSQEVLNGRTSGFYLFFDKIHLMLPSVEGKKKVIIGAGNFLTYVGFFTNYPDLYQPKFIVRFSYKNRKYTAYSNDYSCASPRVLRAALAKRLIDASPLTRTSDSIKHPCIPTQCAYTMSPEELTSHCDSNKKKAKLTKFIGALDFVRCRQLIQDLLCDESMYDASEYGNLAANDGTYPPNTKHKVTFYNEFFDSALLPQEKFIELLDGHINSQCNLNKSAYTKREIDQCFYLIYVSVLFEQLFLHGQNEIIGVKQSFEYRPSFDDIYIYGDHRFGLGQYDDVIPTSSDTIQIKPDLFGPSVTPVSTVIKELSPGLNTTLSDLRMAVITIFIVAGLGVITTLAVIFYKRRENYPNRLFVSKCQT